MTKYLYIETVGCQMNVLDSELVVAALRKDGYQLTDSPKQADTILFNTCSVRATPRTKSIPPSADSPRARRRTPKPSSASSAAWRRRIKN